MAKNREKTSKDVNSILIRKTEINEVLILVCLWSLKVFQVLWLQNNTASLAEFFGHILKIGQ